MSETIQVSEAQDIEFVVDEAASLLRFAISLPDAKIPFEISLSLISEKDIRALRTRRDAYDKARLAFNETILRSQTEEALERAEQGLFAVKDYFIAILKKIFLSDAITIPAKISLKDGSLVDKEVLAGWMQGDFLIAWGVMFYEMVESQMILLKKKVHSQPSDSTSGEKSTTS